VFVANVYRVMIVSPSDVIEERAIVRHILLEWNAVHASPRGLVVLPMSWDTHTAPEMGAEPQEIINKQILRDADLLVAIFWTRLGTPTSRYPSGSVEEIEEHLAAGRPAMLYFSDRPIRPNSVETTQREQLLRFRESLTRRGLLETYDDLASFREKFSRHLQITLNSEDFRGLLERMIADHAPVVSRTPSLTPEAEQLLREVSHDSSGGIFRIEFAGGVAIQTNGKVLNEPDNPRSVALWTHVLEDLLQQELIRRTRYDGNHFELTLKGFEVADELNAP
jgi:hypothetical protein